MQKWKEKMKFIPLKDHEWRKESLYTSNLRILILM